MPRTRPDIRNCRSSLRSADDSAITDDFKSFIKDRAFPCVGAKSALAKDQLHIYVGHDIVSAWDDVEIAGELVDFAHDYRETRTLFRTYAVIFPESPPLGEEAFEQALWDRVASLRAKDEWLGQPYDPRVDDDPVNPKFSLSFGGEAFFIVGLHPHANRPARKFAFPALVFNLHDQFERLRADGRYDPMREAILARDLTIAGSTNPMLERFGEGSEARQYSGRMVGDDWVCPYPGRGGSK